MQHLNACQSVLWQRPENFASLALSSEPPLLGSWTILAAIRLLEHGKDLETVESPPMSSSATTHNRFWAVMHPRSCPDCAKSIMREKLSKLPRIVPIYSIYKATMRICGCHDVIDNAWDLTAFWFLLLVN
jgi:hypothetical protein